ncbi:MAG: hypothetical protein H0V37_12490 [Chloroflexia bacterium]|nr:hypothetical protein [Chloroflexia bacterium]
MTGQLEAGDQAATAGDWVEAITVWEQLLDTDEGPDATQRVRWFLAEASPGDMVRESPWHRRGTVLIVAIGSAVAGTACVFAAQEVTGFIGIVFAAAAWLFYIAAATLAVAYAFGVGNPSRGNGSRLDPSELRRAHELARELSRSSGADRAATI